ncbi:hypothetical protein [Marinicella sp. W31]|uniref:hypothetical protein n=1 Tax=Marinicella sp. W31 TaxID=3023713 RepID=UPI0037563EF5
MNKYSFNTFLMIYVGLISLLNLTLWFLQYMDAPRNGKILIGILLAAAAVLFTDKISDDEMLAPAIKLFGFIAATAICITMLWG